MKSLRNSRLLWLAGVATAWAAAWMLLGIRVLLILKDRPHPFLPQIELTKIVVKATTEWALSALGAYVGVGLLLGLLGKLFTSDRTGSELGAHLTFGQGAMMGAGTLLFFHGVLYTMVPMTLVGIPILKSLPMGLSLLLFLTAGAFILYRVFRRECRHHRILKLTALLLTLALIPQVPHDLFRRSFGSGTPLPKDAPRILVFGIDGARKDVFEKHMPDWKAPSGVNPVCYAPATRRSWSMLLGKDPDKLKNSIIMPFQSDLGHPEEFKLLALAREKQIRTAWAIDDSLTAGFGNQPNWFTTVRESPGGWKYWFTLGLGNVFPVYSWTQNYIAPVENTNPWADFGAYCRDIGRLLETHHWVFAHTCVLHEPIRMTFQELQVFRPWAWLLDPVANYRSYVKADDIQEDQGRRLDLRSSALYHYSARLGLMLPKLRPYTEAWAKDYPGLSGVITSDHGELHIQLTDDQGKVLTHLEGYHGFALDPPSMWVPLHIFGQARQTFHEKQVFSWIELRDSIQQAALKGGPLVLHGREEPLLIQFPTIRAVHLESEEERQKKKDTGIDPKDLISDLYVMPNGLWFATESNRTKLDSEKVSTGIVEGERLRLFNPSEDNMFDREVYLKYQPQSKELVPQARAQEEIAPYKKYLPAPMTLEGNPGSRIDAQRPGPSTPLVKK